MSRGCLSQVAFRGVVCSIPGVPLAVEDLADGFGLPEINKIKKMVGVSHVHRAVPHTTTADLCFDAAVRLMEALSIEATSIDAVLLVTQTPDYFSPATACVLHGRLGLGPQCAAFDVNQGCSGYVYGLSIASSMISSGLSQRVLLLAGDTTSRTVAPGDRALALLFGDAGSATLLERDTSAPSITFRMGSDGLGYDKLIIEAGAYRTPYTPDMLLNADPRGCTKMDGLAVFDFTLDKVPPLIHDTLEEAGMRADDVQHFLLHQANKFMLERLAKKAGIPLNKVPINIDRFGNTTVASIPIVLAELLESTSEPLGPLLLAGFGVGLSWGAAAWNQNQPAYGQLLYV